MCGCDDAMLPPGDKTALFRYDSREVEHYGEWASTTDHQSAQTVSAIALLTDYRDARQTRPQCLGCGCLCMPPCLIQHDAIHHLYVMWCTYAIRGAVMPGLMATPQEQAGPPPSYLAHHPRPFVQSNVDAAPGEVGVRV